MYYFINNSWKKSINPHRPNMDPIAKKNPLSAITEVQINITPPKKSALPIIVFFKTTPPVFE